jgi:hypothetical protein
VGNIPISPVFKRGRSQLVSRRNLTDNSGPLTTTKVFESAACLFFTYLYKTFRAERFVKLRAIGSSFQFDFERATPRRFLLSVFSRAGLILSLVMASAAGQEGVSSFLGCQIQCSVRNVLYKALTLRDKTARIRVVFRWEH